MPAARRPDAPIPYVDLPAQFAEEREELLAAFAATMERGQFIGGIEIEQFERDIARYLGVPHAVALDSGTAALILALICAGIRRGDEVITPPNSFVASTATIVHIGARPVFADVGPDQNFDPAAVAAAITPRTRAIMVVHLTGRCCDMDSILALAKRHDLVVIEDAAQAIGARYKGRMSGSMGQYSCFSTHPLKILNCPGDGGFITVPDEATVKRVKTYRNHGLVDRNTLAEWGTVARMDNIQAAALNVRLPKLDRWIARRRAIVARYRQLLDAEFVFIPPDRDHEFNTYQTLVIQVDRRDELQDHLGKLGIGSAIHYPVPIHLQKPAAFLGYRRGQFPVTERQAGRILSIPAHQYMSDDQVEIVAGCINDFFRTKR
ncbi:MAG: DegT/DnrJ/EryC1/StrS family aminotransferase [Alphaproteobacteria bacterium]|nr:DegT/DnrJ/EryC1/StrS family aminotransferase [Alphaproteobacteria bacterium]